MATSTSPWIDEKFAGLDTRREPDFLQEDFIKEALTPEQLAELEKASAAEGHPAPAAVPAAAPAVEVVAADEPEVFKLTDGATLTIERGPSGVKATLDPGNGGGIEVFHGKDDAEVMRQGLVGKLNASKKIREQNQIIKMRIPRANAPAALPAPAQQEKRTLSENDLFEIKTQLAANPELALDTLFQKKVGLSISELAAMAKRAEAKAQEAEDGLVIDTEAKAFLEEHPRYAITPANRDLIYGWIAAQKLGKEMTRENYNEVMDLLVQKGLYTRDVLAEAYDDLTADGLLVLEAPEEPAPAPPLTPAVAETKGVASKTEAPKTGIQPVRTERRGAAYGIRASQTTRPPDTPQALTGEELEDMSDEQVNKLMADAIRERARQRAQR